jgi:hypothetical protein
LLTLAGASAATEEPARFALSWVRLQGAESCPGRAELAREVAGRLGRNPFSEDADRSFEVVASRADGQWLVRIHVRDRDGQTLGFRTLDSRDDDCSGVFSATALALALTADPDLVVREAVPQTSDPGSVAPPTPPARAPAAREASPSAPVTVPPNTGEPSPAPEAPVVRRVVVVERPVPVEPKPTLTTPGQPLAFAAGPLLGVGVVPGIALGAALRGAWQHQTGWGWQIAGRFVKSNRTGASAEPAEFGIGLSAASTAVSFAPLNDDVRFALGAGLHFGALHVTVYAPAPTRGGPGDYLWAALGPHADLAVRLKGPVRLGLFLEALIPLTRHRFFIENEPLPAYESGRLGGLGSAYIEITSE